MLRAVLALGLSGLMQLPAAAACLTQNLVGPWMLRGEGQPSGVSAEYALCAASARAVFSADGTVRFSKIHSVCDANNLISVSASGTFQFSESTCMGSLSLTDSLGYTTPVFWFVMLNQPDEILAVQQHRRQKVLYRWRGEPQ